MNAKGRSISVRTLFEDERLRAMHLEVAAGAAGLDRRWVTNPRLQKPGLALAGYLPYVKPGRVQILGESEYAYLATMDPGEAASRLIRLVELEVPCIVSAKGLRPSEEVLRRSDELEVPFLASAIRTSDLIGGLSAFLEGELAPRVQLHGVLVDVFSLGTLIVGDAGIGKSECALELVYRGHRLVADDLVVIRRTHAHGLVGSPHELLENYLELRGVGIIDLRNHFGMTATSPSIPVSLVIRLVKLGPDSRKLEQKWREQVMENPHSWPTTEEILGIEIPLYTMVVAPGRDLAIMVETAVRKCLLAQRGIQDERDFLEAINDIAARRGVDTDEGSDG